MSAVSTEIELGFGVPFEDLYNRDGLVRLDGVFLHHLTTADPNLNARLANARSNPNAIPAKDRSELIIELAPHVEDFLGELFGISKDIHTLAARHNALAPLFAFKRKFIQKRAISGVTREQADCHRWPGACFRTGSPVRRAADELKLLSQHVSRWLENRKPSARPPSRPQRAMPPGPHSLPPDPKTSSRRSVQSRAQAGSAAFDPGRPRPNERSPQASACPRIAGAIAKDSS